MFHKIVKTLIFIIITLIVLILIAYGVSKSDFSNIKKYDEKDTSPRSAISSMKDKIAKERYYTTKVRIKSGEMASLGDFTMNISGNRKLTANVSLKFKNNASNSWIGGDNVEKEIISKGDILRSAVVHVISDSQNADISNSKMKREMVDTMNNYLSEGKIEEVYFNKFIIQ